MKKPITIEEYKEYLIHMNDEGVRQICFIDLSKKPLFVEGVEK